MMMMNYFPLSLVKNLLVRGKDVTCLCVSSFMGTWVYLQVMMKKTISALLTCIFTLGGAIVGTIIGGLEGNTTETGVVRGAGIGAVSGAITALELMESMADGDSFSKVALLSSLVNGKVFVEWVTPAILTAYQWQISSMEVISSGEVSDLFEAAVSRGLSQDYIKKLPKYKVPTTSHATPCTICLQDLKEGESARTPPTCTHSFHLQCIDEWLIRHGTCPVCRRQV